LQHWGALKNVHHIAFYTCVAPKSCYNSILELYKDKNMSLILEASTLDLLFRFARPVKADNYPAFVVRRWFQAKRKNKK
jgi:hypothetical protein